MAAKRRAIKSHLKKVDRHRIARAEYDEAPELTREQLAKSMIRKSAKRFSDKIMRTQESKGR